MPLRNLLKKKDRSQEQEYPQNDLQGAPSFTFVRTTTTSQEQIEPPQFPGDRKKQYEGQHSLSPAQPRRHSLFRKHSNEGHGEKTLGEKLHLGSRSRSASSSSVNVPAGLPEIEHSAARGDAEEAQWEKRATLLAKSNSISRTPSPGGTLQGGVSDARGDVRFNENIQEAIRLHESGDLPQSTQMFGRLANPNGANNALSQVLYGLALRHGWGIEKNEETAAQYLSMAAQNSAAVEDAALNAGITKGGAAKGELSLAMFELANCFRNGWGVKKDAVAAKQYYETAANMGDTDAMNEVAWCYLEGFGCKKDKMLSLLSCFFVYWLGATARSAPVTLPPTPRRKWDEEAKMLFSASKAVEYKAAQYLRLAEERGSKTVGNTWIWKDKYGGPRKV